MRKLLQATLLALVVAGCSGGASDATAAAETAASTASAIHAASVTATPTKEKSQSAYPRKIIYKGEVRLATENLDQASLKLETKVREFGGYIGDASNAGEKGAIRQATWTVRIPSTKFDSFVNYLGTLGELQSSKRESQDVSEEYYDVAAHLKNKRAEESRILQILNDKAKKLDDVLTLEKELSRVRGECEEIEGRLRFLSNQTDLSTVTVIMEEVKGFTPKTSPSVPTQVGRTFSDSTSAMQQLGVGILLIVVAVGPWLLPLSIIGFAAWRIFGRKRISKPPTLGPEPGP